MFKYLKHIFLNITISYSYGYNCQKLYNLIVADLDNLIFASGNLIHIFNIPTRTLSFKRTVGGGGIGHITVSEANHIAENCTFML